MYIIPAVFIQKKNLTEKEISCGKLLLSMTDCKTNKGENRPRQCGMTAEYHFTTSVWYALVVHDDIDVISIWDVN